MDNNIDKPQKNSGIGIIVAIFFVFGIVGNFLEDLWSWWEVVIIFLVFIISILSIFWKLKKVWFGSGIKKDNQGFRNIAKSIIEEEKKKQENKFYNKKNTIDEINPQDIDILENKNILDDIENLWFKIWESNENKQKSELIINDLKWFQENENDKLANESDKIKMIIIPIAIIIIFVFVTVLGSIRDGDIKINFDEILIWYWNPNIVWTIVFVLLVFIIGFSIYNYRKKSLK